MSLRIKPLMMEFGCLVGNAFPYFVTSAWPRPLNDREIPVFMFHTIFADRFDAQLRYLADNGYKTLGADSFYGFMTGESRLSGPSVVLTFDDGDQSWHRIAMPLLKKYGFKAIGFVVPGFIREKSGVDVTGKQWMSWPEVVELSESGVMDIQSHTMNHERIFTGPRLIDFMRPGLFSDALKTDRPRVTVNGQTHLLEENGAPIYEWDSRMHSKKKYLDKEDVRMACIAHVASNGGEVFFQRTSWRSELQAVYNEAVKKHGKGYHESDDEQRARIIESLVESRGLLEKRLNKPVLDLAYPWAINGDLAVELSKEAGYRSNYRGSIYGHPINLSGMDPYQIVRLKDDYIFRLPGNGRTSFYDTFMFKLKRRRERADIY